MHIKRPKKDPERAKDYRQGWSAAEPLHWDAPVHKP